MSTAACKKACSPPYGRNGCAEPARAVGEYIARAESIAKPAAWNLKHGIGPEQQSVVRASAMCRGFVPDLRALARAGAGHMPQLTRLEMNCSERK
jgi:hypothetical protein